MCYFSLNDNLISALSKRLHRANSIIIASNRYNYNNSLPNKMTYLQLLFLLQLNQVSGRWPDVNYYFFINTKNNRLNTLIIINVITVKRKSKRKSSTNIIVSSDFCSIRDYIA